jgi:hypothetical protein
MRRVDELEEKMEKRNMRSFMLLHALKNGAHVMIAVEHISVIADRESYTRIYTDDGDYIDVQESFKEITEMLTGRELNL